MFNPIELRRALGSFATGVTVVTTLAEDGGLIGLTANSFSSVSLDPPIILWSLKSSSLSLPAFDACGRFVINVLAKDQVETSQRFAVSSNDKFAGVPHHLNAHGLPVLEGCAASFECHTEQRMVVGDHVLFLGRVEAFTHHGSDGLLYWQGRYGQGMGLDV
jgi:flavin reductase (DIM6/NTAB) family NADH-FMN oxidoreductase RutF